MDKSSSCCKNYSPNISEIKDKFPNVIANLLVCIQKPSSYMIPTVCLFPEKEVNKMLLFIINVGHEEVKIIKGCILIYLILAQYDNCSDARENQENIIANISTATSETKVEILPAITTNSKIIFPGDHTCLR